jgi:MFS family permease
MNHPGYRKVKSIYRLIQPWLIWSLGAAFFFAEYFARVDPSIIIPQLLSAFHVGAFALGSLSAFFYYPYIAMQLPVGTLVDRFGPRRLLTMAAFVCGSACLFFAVSQTIWQAELARALMGFSAAFAFVGTLKLATLWFHPRRLGLLAGLTQGVGMLGAAVGEGAFSFVVAKIGWRYTMVLIAAFMFLLALLIGVLVREKRPSLLGHMVPETGQIKILDSLMILFRNSQSWRIAIYAGLIYAPTGAFAELWGPSFLYRVYGVSHQIAALAVSLIFVGLAVGGPLVGWISDRVGKRRPILVFSALLSLVFISLVLYIPHLPIVLLFLFLFLYGISNMGIALSYAVSSELNPRPIAGVSVAFTNMASVLIVAALQPLIGWMLEFHWQGLYTHGYPFYSAVDYQQAMVMLPAALVLACIVALSVRETHCQGK